MSPFPLSAADLESLLMKHPAGAPRYACYPTPERFAVGFGPAELRKALERRGSFSVRRPLALIVNVGGASRDCGADAEHAAMEAALYRELLGRREGTAQLHIAAGNAEGLRVEAIARLVDRLGKGFTLPPRDARSIEIHAFAGSERALGEAAALGFGRLCLTARGQAPLESAVGAAVEAIERARRAGISCVGAEIRYGAPAHTAGGFAAALERLVRARPKRVTLRGYWAPGNLPPTDRAVRAAILACAIERLSRSGYEYAGLDVFELPDEAAKPAPASGVAARRACPPYPLHGRSDVLGLGACAVSAIGDCYSQNACSPQDYAGAVRGNRLPVARGHRMTPDDLLRREIIHSLECEFALSFSALEYRYGVEFAPYFAEELARLEEMQSDGLIELYEDAIEVTAAGRPLVRAVSALFDRYLRRCAVQDAGAACSRN